MKQIKLFFLLPIFVLSDDIYSQHSIELKGRFRKELQELSIEYVRAFGEDVTTAPSIYVIRSGEITEYFIGLSHKSNVLKNLPSWYFFVTLPETKRRMPVFVYTGFENEIEFATEYKNEIESLWNGEVDPNGIIAFFHFNLYYLKFRNDEVVKVIKGRVGGLPKKLSRKVPDWVM